MTSLRLSAVLLLFLGVTLFGQETPIAVDPPDPTSSESVTLLIKQFDTCPPDPIVERSGFEIAVTVGNGPCGGPPTLHTHRIELGILPAGHYNVTANTVGGSLPATFSFVVLDANSGVIVLPGTGSTAGGATVNIAVAAGYCLGRPVGSCPPPTITFGGIPATNIVIERSLFRATTPPHAAGPVEVTVSDGTFTKSSYAFRYFDPAAEPSGKVFERVLLPVVFNGPGAFGSMWVTELSLRNDNDYPVEPWRAIGGARFIAPLKPAIFSGDAPNGIFLLVPRQAIPNLSFHAAVRDTSRADREWATEIPVVHESQFTNMPVELLDIPIDTRFRTMVRIYSAVHGFAAFDAHVHVTVYSLDDGSILREVFPTLVDTAGCSDAVSCAEHPSYTSIADLMSGLPAGRAGVQIQAFVPIWAFATVTNNDTQHVTVVSPH